MRALLVLLVLLAFSSVGASPLTSLPQAVSLYRMSVFKIEVEFENRSTGALLVTPGTGFLISPHGYVVTSEHVVRPPTGYTIARITGRPGSAVGRELEMEWIAISPNADGALLRLKDSSHRTRAIPTGNPSSTRDGDRLYGLGFPGLDEWFSTEGAVGSVGGPGGTWTTDLALDKGMSGGPILNNEGKVVAIVWGGVPGSGQTRNRVVPVNLLYDLWARAGVKMNQDVRSTLLDPDEQLAIRTLEGLNLLPGAPPRRIFFGSDVAIDVSLLNGAVTIAVQAPDKLRTYLRVTGFQSDGESPKNYALDSGGVTCFLDQRGVSLDECDTKALGTISPLPDGRSHYTWHLPADEVNYERGSARFQLMSEIGMLHRFRLNW